MDFQFGIHQIFDEILADIVFGTIPYFKAVFVDIEAVEVAIVLFQTESVPRVGAQVAVARELAAAHSTELANPLQAALQPFRLDDEQRTFLVVARQGPERQAGLVAQAAVADMVDALPGPVAHLDVVRILEPKKFSVHHQGESNVAQHTVLAVKPKCGNIAGFQTEGLVVAVQRPGVHFGLAAAENKVRSIWLVTQFTAIRTRVVLGRNLCHQRHRTQISP